MGRILGILLVWFVIVGIFLILYVFKDDSPVKEALAFLALPGVGIIATAAFGLGASCCE